MMNYKSVTLNRNLNMFPKKCMQLDKAHAAFLNFLGLKLTLTKT